MQSVFIARQPVYNRELQPIGYELLYRARNADRAEVVNGDEASVQVILNSFINIGIDRLVGSALAFVNVPEALVLNDGMLPMFHEQTVLELLDASESPVEILAGIRRLRSRGFRIALNESRDAVAMRPLLELADFIKVDVQVWGATALARQVTQLRAYPAKLIAEKVESPAQYRECKALGFDCFQGYFFCRPETLEEKTPAPSKVVVLTLLQQLTDPRTSMESLQATLANDVAMSYKLLRYANSAAFGQRREIESLKDAMVLVGLNTLRNWAALVLLNNISAGKPLELMKVGMIRARMCEQLARSGHPALYSQMFIVGLFSVLDAVMDLPMDTLLDHLSLSAPVRFALLDREGEAGRLLQQVLWYEQGDWDALIAARADRGKLVPAYLEAVHWADTNMHALYD